jgi:hypothetical protein
VDNWTTDLEAALAVGLSRIAYLAPCTTVHPLYTIFSTRIGASISEVTMRPNARTPGRPLRALLRRTDHGPAGRGRAAGGCRRQAYRARSQCRFRNSRPEYVSKSGIKWLSGSTKRECDRALGKHIYCEKPTAGNTSRRR